MKTKKIETPDVTNEQPTEKRKQTRSPEYEEARLKKEIRIASDLQVKASEKFQRDNEARLSKIRNLKDELDTLQANMASQPTLP